MPFPNKVKLVEVGARDGLQNESIVIPTEIKIEFIDQLTETGLSHIEVTSFVSPKWIPQLADHLTVFQSIKKNPKVHYSALIPNLKGLEAALSVGVNEIAVFTTPSQQFSQKNTHCSVEESLQRIEEIITACKIAKIKSIRGYISCVLECPYEGNIPPEKVSHLAAALFEMGCNEISLGDTIGRGTPFQVQHLINTVASNVPLDNLAVHFHDTYGQALANIYVALSQGISIIDSSVAGLGGCPYAKGASGNVATEDVLYMLNGMGIETGVDLQKLIMAGRFITEQLGRKPQSKTSLATEK